MFGWKSNVFAWSPVFLWSWMSKFSPYCCLGRTSAVAQPQKNTAEMGKHGHDKQMICVSAWWLSVNSIAIHQQPCHRAPRDEFRLMWEGRRVCSKAPAEKTWDGGGMLFYGMSPFFPLCLPPLCSPGGNVTWAAESAEKSQNSSCWSRGRGGCCWLLERPVFLWHYFLLGKCGLSSVAADRKTYFWSKYSTHKYIQFFPPS